MRRRISMRGCVRPSVRLSVTPSLRRLLGASYTEYSALLLILLSSLVLKAVISTMKEEDDEKTGSHPRKKGFASCIIMVPNLAFPLRASTYST